MCWCEDVLSCVPEHALSMRDRAQAEADARQQASEQLEALQSLVAEAAADHGLPAGPATGQSFEATSRIDHAPSLQVSVSGSCPLFVACEQERIHFFSSLCTAI